MKLIDHTALLHDFSDTAAMVCALDLVVAVDTSTVHVAAGLGRPVWMLSRYDQCWRWITGRTDSHGMTACVFTARTAPRLVRPDKAYPRGAEGICPRAPRRWGISPVRSRRIVRPWGTTMPQGTFMVVYVRDALQYRRIRAVMGPVSCYNVFGCMISVLIKC